MRAIGFFMVLGATTCATDKPAEVPAHTITDVEVDPPDSDAPASIANAQQYVGLRSTDLLLDAPDPLLPRGERILDDTSSYGLVALRIDGGHELLFLDRRTDEGDFIVEAVLELSAGVTWEQVAWEGCEVDGALDPHVVAVVAADAGCEPSSAPASLAWRADPKAGQFKTIAPDNVRCLPPTCDRATDDNVLMGVAGGEIQ
jgi:hypothetical protein